ncbi:hydrogen peroxide-inducible genes activator [Balneatrix alpica]|uniref:LysR substrate-binding domain-containing protein n=1 Tax=Balneatrix alpica TaxID=75684 RepID=A0ABV5ZA64_9GAMM|nr:hydrogen peroxide-inducible genes activator [Balneatrix alpica]
MTLTELKYIVTLAQEQHFGRAADRCYVSQPTLSVAVKKLEDELGVLLFERSKNAVRVTDMGEQIVRQAQRVLEESERIRELASAGKDQLRSPLRVGAIYTIGPYLFPHLVPQLQQAAPQMPLYIEENYTAVLRRKLRNGELDAIIVALPFTEPDVVTLPLYDEVFVMLLPSKHPLAQEQEVKADQLKCSDMLLLGEGHCFRDQVLQACPSLKQASDPQQAITEGSSLETLRHMVASGFGVTILPQSAAGEGLYAPGLLCTRPFSSPQPMRTVALAWRASFPRPKAIDVLRDTIKQCNIRLS